VLRRPAAAEFDEAFDWYEAQRPGLGAAFAVAVQHTFDRIVAHPGAQPLVLGDVRKAVVRRFPYCIYYRIHPDRLEVIAVFHTRREPSAWQRRK
jgi:plasmid stabilization system protein ParE